MLDQKELDAIRTALVRAGKKFSRLIPDQYNYLVLMEECQREGKRVTEAYAAEVLGRLMNEHRVKVSSTVEEIRQILNEPQNWRYANQKTAYENEIVKRYNENPDFKNIRDFIDFAVTHGEIPGKDNESSFELPVNPVWVNIYQTLRENHRHYNVTCDGSRQALENWCRERGLPLTLENLESAFQALQKIKDKLPHSEEWREAQARARTQAALDKEAAELRASLLAAYKEPFERRLVGQHWVKTDPKLLTHLPALVEKELARLSSLSVEQLRAEAAARATAIQAKEAESDEKQRLAALPREELSQIANQGRSTFQRFEPLPSSYSPPGKPDVFLPWTRQLIKRLPAFEVKKLLRLYGADQIEAAVAAAKGN